MDNLQRCFDFSLVSHVTTSKKYIDDHALIGVSPFNSYFSQENLEKLLSWGLDNFKDIHILIPNEIYKYTFQALGYSVEDALRKTKKQDRYLKNKVIRALENVGLSSYEIEEKIVFLSDLGVQSDYMDLYKNCLHLFETDNVFRNGCLSTSRWILDNKGICNTTRNDDVTNTAVKYFLAELPLFLNTCKILGVNSSTFVYQDIPKFLKHIFEYGLFVHQKQKFLEKIIDY